MSGIVTGDLSAAPVWEEPTSEIPRDHWGRPFVVPPSGGKPVAYTRCTTYVGCLEDTYNLGQYQRRMVAAGLAVRPDLQLRVASLGLPPTDDAKKDRWKNEMNKVCEAATEAAKASASATIGIALHALTERLDRGQDVGVVPEQYLGHLRAYEQATAAFAAVHIERFTVLDELRIGGTPDRVLKIDGHDKLIIGDVKSGSVEYGVGKMAMQLAVYARSVLYDHETATRVPLGDVDTDRGLIIALDAKSGTCELHWIDLRAGWDAVQLARQVRAWRARRDLMRPYEATTQGLPVNPTVAEQNARDLTVEAAAALRVAIRMAATIDELVHLWSAAGTAWTHEHTALATARKHELQQTSA